MPGNYRYEEERIRGQRGTRRGGFGERGREDDEMEQYAGERYGPNYGRDYGNERFQDEGSWGRQSGSREYGRSLGGRETFEGYEDDEDSYGSPYSAGGREGGRYQGGYSQGSRGQRWSGRSSQGTYQGGQGAYQGYQGGQGAYPGYQGGQGYQGSWQGGQGSWQGQRGGSMQADGWTGGEPDEMRWGRQQGLYGPSEYGGYISSQRSQADYQSHVGKGPKGWHRSDERIRDEVSEALARHPEIDASDIEVRVQDGEITLTGTVTDRRTKRLAEDVAERVFGASDVANQIKVNASTARGRGERDVTAAPDREGRTGTEGQETQTRKAGTGATAGTTTR